MQPTFTPGDCHKERMVGLILFLSAFLACRVLLSRPAFGAFFREVFLTVLYDEKVRSNNNNDAHLHSRCADIVDRCPYD